MNNNNTGDWNTGDWNTGGCNSGHRNTGHNNTGDWNSGDWNSGHRNSGNRNTGDLNTEDCNSGDRNSGLWNSGDCNTGLWNSGDKNTGYFNTDEPPLRMFNKPTDAKREEIDFPDFLYFNLTEWINEPEMTDKEKEENSSYKTTGGYLKTKDYKEAFQESYRKASKEDREKIKLLPNFDADIFFEISGIRVDGEEKIEISLDEIAEKFGIDVSNLKIKK